MTDRPSLAKLDLSRGLMARQVTRALRQAIVSMRISPRRMLEQDLAQRFGVSCSPVREALIKLSEAGLVQAPAARGTQVVKISLGRRGGCALHPRGGRTRRRAGSRAQGHARHAGGTQCQPRPGSAAASGGCPPTTSWPFDEEFHRLLAETMHCRPSAWSMIEDVKPLDGPGALSRREAGDAAPSHHRAARHDRRRHQELRTPALRRGPCASTSARSCARSRSSPRQYPELFEPEADALPEVLSA